MAHPGVVNAFDRAATQSVSDPLAAVDDPPSDWLLRPSERLGGAAHLELLRWRQAERVLDLAREEAWMP